MQSKLIKEAIKYIIDKSSKQVPEVFSPVRKFSKEMSDEFESIAPNSSIDEWENKSVGEKAMNVGKQAVSYMGRTASEVPNVIASALSSSPPGQVAQYSMGNPNPKKQMEHGMEAIMGAFALGGYLKPQMTIPKKEILRNALGQFKPKDIRWVTDLQKL